MFQVFDSPGKSTSERVREYVKRSSRRAVQKDEHPSQRGGEAGPPSLPLLADLVEFEGDPAPCVACSIRVSSVVSITTRIGEEALAVCASSWTPPTAPYFINCGAVRVPWVAAEGLQCMGAKKAAGVEH